MSKFVRVKNEVPEILELLMNHDDCPDWLSDVIGNQINDRTHIGDEAKWFRFALSNIAENGRTGHYPHHFEEVEAVQ